MAIHLVNRRGRIPASLRTLRRDLTEILRSLDLGDREVTVVLTGDSEIRDLNARYLGRDRPTNVLSFSMEGEGPEAPPHRILGDVVISVDTAMRDAREGGIPLEDELFFLMIHGLLHLAGYDHERAESDEASMKALERELFRKLKGYEID
jgi:probable rRNA maturation factor